jgi:hypothetical protein
LASSSASFSVLGLYVGTGAAIFCATVDISIHAVNANNKQVLLSDFRSNVLSSPSSVLTISLIPQAQLSLANIVTGIDFFDTLAEGLSLSASLISKPYDVTMIQFNTSFDWNVTFNAGALGIYLRLRISP